MAVGQSPDFPLTQRYRGHAPSHIFDFQCLDG